MSSAIRIEMLGALVLKADRLTVTRFRTRKTALLLAVLASHRDRIFPRDELSDLLWPDDTLESGRNGLRIALSSLRRILEPPGTLFGAVLHADRSSVKLNGEAFSTDVEDFERTARSDRGLEEAFRLYGGEYLPGFTDEWVLAERQRLEEQYFNVLNNLAEEALAAGDSKRSVEMAKRAIQIDPYAERSYQTAIAAYGQARRPAAARQMEEAMRSRFERDATPALLPGRPPPPKEPLERAQKAEISPNLVSRLPAYYTKFYGRAVELDWLQSQLESPDRPRLITLTGPGGVGKTRLAVESVKPFGSRVWFVPLADLREGDDITTHLASSLDSQELEAGAFDRIKAVLDGPDAVLILDNLEQTLGSARELVARLLGELPRLTVLATSRRRLEVEAEFVYPLETLPIPGAGVADLEAVAANPSVQLFLDRARAVRPDFAITAKSAQDIAEICGMVSGLPLALELAAARVRVLSSQELRRHAESRLELLASTRSDRAPRHQSLRNSLDWSYELLSPEEQRALARVSVFRGGWTLAAAKAVLEDIGPSLDIMDGLAADSLTTVSKDEAETRYSLLEPVREYAATKLGVGESAVALNRVADFYLEFSTQAASGLEKADQRVWLLRIERELPNLRVARRILEEREDPGRVAFAANLWPYFSRKALVSEGREWLQSVLAAPGPVGEDRFRALLAAAKLADGQFDLADSRALAEKGRREAETAGLPLWVAEFLGQLGIVTRRAGDVEGALELWQQARAVVEPFPESEILARIRMNLAIDARDRENYEEANRLYDLALPTYERIGDPHRLGIVYQNLGLLAADQGDMGASFDYLERALSIRQSIGDAKGEAFALGAMGQNALAVHDYERAWKLYRDCLDQCIKLDYRTGQENCLWDVALGLTMTGPHELASRLLGAISRLHQELGLTLLPHEEQSLSAGMDRLTAALGEQAVSRETARGRRMTFDEAVQLLRKHLAEA